MRTPSPFAIVLLPTSPREAEINFVEVAGATEGASKDPAYFTVKIKPEQLR